MGDRETGSMEEQPGQQAQPQYSPDGKWWWDGAKWVAAQQAAPAPGGPIGPPRRRRRWPWVVGGLAVLALIGIIAAAANGGGGSPKAATSPTTAPTHAAAAQAAVTPKPTATPAAPAAPKVLLDLTGSGIKNSAEFSAPSHWRIHYTYDCTAFGQQGNFQIFVEQGSTPLDAPVNELGAKGDSTTDVYQGGTVHLSMNSECDWHVTAMAA
jgi:hypothetical protein